MDGAAVEPQDLTNPSGQADPPAIEDAKKDGAEPETPTATDPDEALKATLDQIKAWS